MASAKIADMNPPFLNVPHAEILAKLTAVVAQAAGMPLPVRVSAEAYGHRNVGVDLPRAKRAAEGLVLRLAVTKALRTAGVHGAPHALVPKVDGSVTGNVQVAEIAKPTTLGRSC